MSAVDKRYKDAREIRGNREENWVEASARVSHFWPQTALERPILSQTAFKPVCPRSLAFAVLVHFKTMVLQGEDSKLHRLLVSAQCSVHAAWRELEESVRACTCMSGHLPLIICNSKSICILEEELHGSSR